MEIRAVAGDITGIKSDAIIVNHYAVDTSRDITPVLNKIVREASR
jgi:hypothetical protein